jgi:hypothetical protein
MVLEPELRKCLAEEKCCWWCGGTEIIEGPCGGMSQNVECASCGAKFNICLPFQAEFIGDPTKAPGCLVVGRQEVEEVGLSETVSRWVRSICEKASV